MNSNSIKTQYQDDKGYIRAIKFKSGLVIQTSPLIPFVGDVELKKVDEIPSSKTPTTKDLAKFAKENGAKFTHKRTSSPTGLWFVTPHIKRGFVSTSFSSSDKIPEVKEAPMFWIPIQENSEKLESSLLQTSINNARIAKHLQSLALYSYSKNKKEDKWYVGIKGAYDVEDVSDVLPPKDSSFWKDGKVVVTNKEILDRLKMHIKTELFNDTSRVRAFKDRLFLPPIEEPTKKYLTFHTLDDMKKWAQLSGTLKDEFAVRSQMYDCFYPKPYFFRKLGKTYLVQTSKSGKLRDAVGLLNYWNENKVNKGYDATFNEEVDDVPSDVFVFDLSFELKIILEIAKEGKLTRNALAEAALNDSLTYNRIFSTDKLWWNNFITYLLDQTIFIREDVGKIYAQTLDLPLSWKVYTAMLPVD